MTNFFSSVYFTLVLFILCVAGAAACVALCVDLIAIRSVLACAFDACVSSDVPSAAAVSFDTTAPVGFAALGWCGLNFQNLERFPETIEELAPNTRNPEKAIALNKRINAQSERLEALFNEIAANAADPKHSTTSFGYESILPWKERQAYEKRTAAATLEARLYKAEALAEAKEADDCEEFQQGYKEFLASEFEVDHSVDFDLD